MSYQKDLSSLLNCTQNTHAQAVMYITYGDITLTYIYFLESDPNHNQNLYLPNTNPTPNLNLP